MLRKVHLYGALGKEFGRVHSFEADTIADVIEALRCNFSRFFNAIRYGHYRVVVGSQRKGMELDEAMLPGFKLGSQALHIIPVTEGAKRGGLGKIIAGVALIGLSAFTGGLGGVWTASMFAGAPTLAGAMGAIGTSLLLTGVATMLAPEQKMESEDKSFTMSGPQVVTREGGIVPIAYGEVITGGTMISGALRIAHTKPS